MANSKDIFKILMYTLAFQFILESCVDSRIKTTKFTPSKKETIFQMKDSVGGGNYPFPESHASTLLRLDNGQFLVAWFGGTKEGNDDVGIWISKGKPGSWLSPSRLAKIRNDAHWNPVLFKTPTGEIYLFFKVGKTIAKWETWQMASNDEGITWSRPSELIPGDKGGRGPVRNKPLLLSDGTLLAGASNEDGNWNVFVDRSTDMGKTWTATPYLKLNRKGFKGKGVIQPTLWEAGPGKVHMLVRSTNDFIYRSDSKDYGKTWSPLYKTSLNNPNSAIDIAKLSDKTLALAFNPTTRSTGNRSKLCIALSYDNGETWPHKMVIEEQENAGEGFAYPAIISFGDTIAMTYTWKRKKIMFWEGTKELIVESSQKQLPSK